jgi:hypothetical protein
MAAPLETNIFTGHLSIAMTSLPSHIMVVIPEVPHRTQTTGLTGAQ